MQQVAFIEPRPVRVLQILTQDAVGGTELMVATLTRRLDPETIHAEVAILDVPGQINRAMSADGIKVHALGPGISGAIRLAKVLRHGQYHVAHAYGFKGPMLVRLLVNLFAPRTRCLVGVQGVVPAEAAVGSRKARMTIWADRATARLVDRYEANSRGAIRQLERAGVPAEKLRYIPNAIDLQDWPGTPQKRDDKLIVIACVGRFIPRKRQADLVRAFATLRAEQHQCRLVFAGDGPSEPEVRRLAREHGIEEQVEFSGLLDTEGVRALLRRVDIYAQPSLYEGMPATVLEAMACSLPVLGTRVNGIEDLVEDGVTGLLVESGAVDEMCVCLRRLVDHPELRHALGRAGRERVAESFDLQRVIVAKTDLYLELAGV